MARKTDRRHGEMLLSVIRQQAQVRKLIAGPERDIYLRRVYRDLF